jgi:CheY-like chemotaxis protein
MRNDETLNIVLVEDDDGDAKAVRRAFRNLKVANQILRAVDGVEALDMLRGANGRVQISGPYIVLVDLNMPRMNGIDFIQALRRDENLRRAVVFVLTTSNRREDRCAAYNLNIAGYIVKANAGHELLSLVDLIDRYTEVVEMP